MLNIYISPTLSKKLSLMEKQLLNIDPLTQIHYSIQSKIVFDLAISDDIEDIKEILICYQKCILILVVHTEEQIFSNQKMNIRYFVRDRFLRKDFAMIHDSLFEGLKNKITIFKYKEGLFEYEIKKDSIQYIESFHNVAVFHTDTAIINLRITIKSLLEELDSPFIRCHKSYIVHMNYIQSFCNQEIVLYNQIHIPVGRKYLDSAKIQYQNFIND